MKPAPFAALVAGTFPPTGDWAYGIVLLVLIPAAAVAFWILRCFLATAAPALLRLLRRTRRSRCPTRTQSRTDRWRGVT